MSIAISKTLTDKLPLHVTAEIKGILACEFTFSGWNFDGPVVKVFGECKDLLFHAIYSNQPSAVIFSCAASSEFV